MISVLSKKNLKSNETSSVINLMSLRQTVNDLTDEIHLLSLISSVSSA